MSVTVFVEIKFWLLVVFSFVVPVALYAGLLAKRAVSTKTVLSLGLSFIVIAGLDLFLLQSLMSLAKVTSSIVDDAVFLSELAIGLYLLPVLFTGIGINVISQVLIRHIEHAEAEFEKEHRKP